MKSLVSRVSRLASCVLALGLLGLQTPDSRLQAAQLYVSLVDLGLTAVTNRTVLVTGNSLPRGSSSGVVVADKRRFETGTNNFFWISNAVEGVYLVQVLAQPFASVPTSQTDFRILVTNTTAVLGANTNLVAAAGNTYPSDTVSWGAAASDGRYLLRSSLDVTNDPSDLVVTNDSRPLLFNNDASVLVGGWLTASTQMVAYHVHDFYLKPGYRGFTVWNTNTPPGIALRVGTDGVLHGNAAGLTNQTAHTNNTDLPGVVTGFGIGTNLASLATLTQSTNIAAYQALISTQNYAPVVTQIVNAVSSTTTNADLLTAGALALPRWFHNSTNALAAFTPDIPFAEGGGSIEYGWYFTASTNLSVSRLARWQNTGNTNAHTLRIRDTINSNTVAYVGITAAGSAGWQWAELTAPCYLLANRRYVVSSSEAFGGDTIAQQAASTTQSHIAEHQSVRMESVHSLITVGGWSNQSFGVTFEYAPGPNFIPFTVDTESNALRVATANLVLTNLDAQKIYGSLVGASNGVPVDIGSLWREPPQMAMGSWLIDNFDSTATVFTNALQAMLTNGMYAAGWNWIELSDGSSATNSPYDPNRLLAPNPGRHPLGWAWFTDYCHTNGFKVMAYLAWVPDDSTDIHPNRSRLSQIYRDVLVLKSNAFDGVIIDQSLGGWPDRPTREELVQYVRTIHQAASDWNISYGPGTNRQFYVSVGVNMATGNNINGVLMPNEWTDAVNGYYWNEGMGSSIRLSDWAFNVSRCFNYSWLSRPSHNINFFALRHTGGTTYSTDTWNKIWKMRAAVAGGGSLVSDVISAPTYFSVLTNQEFMSYYKAPDMQAGRRVSSNNWNEVWVRPIGFTGGTNLVFFLNTATNGTTNLTITAANLGVSSNTVMLVRDIVNGTNVATFSGAYTRAETETNVTVYAVMPFPSLDGSGLTNLNALKLINPESGGSVFSYGAGVLTITASPTDDQILMLAGYNDTSTLTLQEDSAVFSKNVIGNGSGLTNLNAAKLTGSMPPAATLPVTNTVEYLRSFSFILGGGGATRLDHTTTSPTPIFAPEGIILNNAGAVGTVEIPVPNWVTQAVASCWIQAGAVMTWTNTTSGWYYLTNNRIAPAGVNTTISADTGTARQWLCTNTWPVTNEIGKSIRLTIGARSNVAAVYFLGPWQMSYR